MIIAPVLLEALDELETRVVGSGHAGSSALDRIRSRLSEARKGEVEVELRFSIPDMTLQGAFESLCRRYGLVAFRAPRQHRTTISVRGPRSFLDQVFDPVFQGLSLTLLVEMQSWVDQLMGRWCGDEQAVREARSRSRLWANEETQDAR